MIEGGITGIAAGILSFAAYLLYIVATLRGTTKPNRATWWILTLVGSLIAASYYSGGARNTIWIALSYVLGPAIIAVLSLWYGEGKWDRLDKVCLTGALISGAVWYFSESSLVALLTNILIDFLGLLPTVKKSYLRPTGEDRPAWTLECMASTLNIFAIERWAFAIAFYPLYLLLINGTVTFFLYLPILKRLSPQKSPKTPTA
ncbi:MAG: hypothetical protein Q7R93_05675 [bacterium]|nr:hypothetical protein [bacterium]